jgi:Zn-dependent M32 family carboxypeptidase
MNTGILVDNTMLVVDWKASVKKAGGNKSAEKLLALFVEQLPDAQKIINEYTQAGKEKIAKLDEALHRLRGASCYSIMPRLQETLIDFNRLVVAMKEEKAHYDHALLQIYLEEFNDEVDALLVESKEFLD